MKCFLMAVATLALTMPAQAQDSPETTVSSLVCKLNSNLAAEIMEKRQTGHVMSETIEALKRMWTTAEDAERIDQYAIEAWETPRFTQDEYIRNSIGDFRNAKFLECFKARKAAHH